MHMQLDLINIIRFATNFCVVKWLHQNIYFDSSKIETKGSYLCMQLNLGHKPYPYYQVHADLTYKIRRRPNEGQPQRHK